MEQRSAHPLDVDLLSYALGEFDVDATAALTSHLEECLLCRIHLNRIRRSDLDVGPAPDHTLQYPAIAPEVIAAIDGTNRPDRIEAGQVWFAGSPRRIAVWIDNVNTEAGFAVVYGGSLDVAAADHTSLIADLPRLGRDLAIFTSVPGTVPLAQLELYAGTLDIASDLDAVIASTEQTPAGEMPAPLPMRIRVGERIDGGTDERLEFRQLLADDLAALDPPGDEEKGDLSLSSAGIDAFEQIVATIRADLETDLAARRGGRCHVEVMPGVIFESFVRNTELTPIAAVHELNCSMLLFTGRSADNEVNAEAAYELLLETGATSLAVAEAVEPYTARVFIRPTLTDAFELPNASGKAGPRPLWTTERPLLNAVFDFLQADVFPIEESALADRDAPARALVLEAHLEMRAGEAIERLKAIKAQKGKNRALKGLSATDATGVHLALAGYVDLSDLLARIEEITGP